MPDEKYPIDLDACEFVSRACAHRRHRICFDYCRHCHSPCQCVCHKWQIPLGGEPVEGT